MQCQLLLLSQVLLQLLILNFFEHLLLIRTLLPLGQTFAMQYVSCSVPSSHLRDTARRCHYLYGLIINLEYALLSRNR